MTTPAGNPPSVALIGAEGHGRWHRRSMRRLAGQGRIRIAGLSARRPVTPSEDAPTEGIPIFTDYRAMLTQTRPDVVIICTPPHTHLTMARDALEVGADLLLEKPPVPTLDEHRRLAVAVREAGRACQINFQALGSAALTEVCDLVAGRGGRDGAKGGDGARGSGKGVGVLSAVDAVGAWWRPDSYFTRSAWAGRRAVDGHPVMDGALVNPFAHAVMQSLAVAQAAGAVTWPITMELERYRSRDIEVDDVACLRLGFASGVRTLVAVTLASATFRAGEIRMAGAEGDALLEYPTDRVRLPGESQLREVPGRIGLLENLLDHRADPGVALLAPLSRTAVFTMIAEAVVAAPLPERIGQRHLSPHADGTGNVVDGIEDLMCQVVAEGALPSELGVGWAAAPHRVTLNRKE